MSYFTEDLVAFTGHPAMKGHIYEKAFFIHFNSLDSISM
jgi:hypothetical protein